MRICVAVSNQGTLVQGIWDWDTRRVSQIISDRVANYHAFPGEHPVRLPRRFSKGKNMRSARALAKLFGNPWNGR
jgi:hypothetical protein